MRKLAQLLALVLIFSFALPFAAFADPGGTGNQNSVNRGSIFRNPSNQNSANRDSIFRRPYNQRFNQQNPFFRRQFNQSPFNRGSISQNPYTQSPNPQSPDDQPSIGQNPNDQGAVTQDSTNQGTTDQGNGSTTTNGKCTEFIPPDEQNPNLTPEEKKAAEESRRQFEQNFVCEEQGDYWQRWVSKDGKVVSVMWTNPLDTVRYYAQGLWNNPNFFEEFQPFPGHVGGELITDPKDPRFNGGPQPDGPPGQIEPSDPK